MNLRLDYLIDNRLDAAVIQYSLNLLAIEIRNTNRFREAQFGHVFHASPRLEVIDGRKDEFSVGIFGKELRIFLHYNSAL